MKIYAIEKDSKENDLGEMTRWFKERTRKHIERVKKYAEKIEKAFPDRLSGLIDQASTHDDSKYGDQELEPYIYLTWKYKCQDDGVDFKLPDGMQERIDKATLHHIENKSNSHHPESHKGGKSHGMIDSSKMQDLDIGEMLADWFAMSEEKDSDPKDWADKNVNVKWKFTDKQKDLIYEIIEIWNL